MRKKVSYLLAALLLSGMLLGQSGSVYFPADPANLHDWRSVMVNPSIGAFHSGAVDLGFKVFHLGFADNNATALKASYAVLNLPRRLPGKLTFGAYTQFFRAGLLQEGELKLVFSRPLARRYALGVSFGLRGMSYDRERFDLVDDDDPLFANGTSRWPLDIAVGLTAMPLPSMTIGMSIRHINSPDISLSGSDAVLNPTLTLGVSFHLNRFAVHGGSGQFERGTTPSAFVQVYDRDLGMAQAGVDQRQLWARGYLRVSGPVSVGYGLSYPLSGLAGSTYGTHEASLAYEFDRLRSVPNLDLPPEEWRPYVPEMARVDLVPQYYVSASVEALDIFAKRLVREVDNSLSVGQIASLSRFDVGVLDTTRIDPLFPYQLNNSEMYDSSATTREHYTRDYLASLKQMRADLAGDSADIVLITQRNQRRRAAGLGNYLREGNEAALPVGIHNPKYASPQDSLRYAAGVRPAELAPSEELVLLKPGLVTFDVLPLLQSQRDHQWRLVVENADDQPVFVHHTNGDSSANVTWDWRDQDGEVIAPGFYRYYIAWSDARGSERRSAPRIIYARQLKRNIHVKISKTYQRPQGGVEKVGIILNKPPVEDTDNTGKNEE